MFEEFGYFKEFYINNKFINIIHCEKDRDIIGYCGKKTEVLTNDIVFKNNKKIKAGTEVQTVIYPLNGKIV
jgi:hypothetical protein